jgi:hypothetical protein
MRLRWILLLAVLLGPIAVAPAQTVLSPIPAEPAAPIDWSAGSASAAPQVWGSAEYLLWWTKSAPLPVPMVTTSNTLDFGVIGAPSTRLLIGNEKLDLPTRNGGRFTLGAWLDCEQQFGVEGNYFFLGSASAHRYASVDGFSPRVISVPFIDLTPGGTFGSPSSVNQENAFVFGAPINVVTGTGFAGIATLSITDQLSGAELNGLMNVVKNDCVRVDLLGGFRYVYFSEKMLFNTSSPTVVPTSPSEFFVTSDSFDGRTDFYCGQIGARVAWSTGNLTLSTTGKVALGVAHEHLGINGSFSTNDFNVPFGTGPGKTFPGGYFALPSNIGSYSRDRFAVVPEAGVNLSYQLTRQLSFSVGYTFLYLNSVVRPGEQIDRGINGAQSALYVSPAPPRGLDGGPDRPQPLFHSTDYWAQGITFGLEFRY